MKKLTSNVLMVVLILSIAGCGLKDKISLKSLRGEKVDQVGVLFAKKSKNCEAAADCPATFLLLDEQFADPIAIVGKIQADHDQLIIEVLGNRKPVSNRLRAKLGVTGDDYIRVKKYRVLSSIKYKELVEDKVEDDSRKKYGCSVLWDRKYSWRVTDAGLPRVIVRMTDALSKRAVKPYIEFWYDANNGKLLKSIRSSDDVSPC